MRTRQWKVVGGADKGGIIVRLGKDTSSTKCDARLATGALLEEKELDGERLRYVRLSGEGPGSGWISIRLKDKDLAVPVAGFDDDDKDELPGTSIGATAASIGSAKSEASSNATSSPPVVRPLAGLSISKQNGKGAAVNGSLRVPWVPPVRGSHLIVDEHLFRWMAQKCKLRQDMFLVGDPGPLMRQAVLQFAAICGREIEYVGITRDTNEADLKQRREINDGHLHFHNAPAVEAALHGRILVLEGIEKAERNVLPLLNNLLENREMALEDGSFLMAPGREAEIAEATDGGRRLLAVSKDFIVVAIGLAVSKYAGSPLDPPLRSRFAARTLSSMPPEEELQFLMAAAPKAPQDDLSYLLGIVETLRASGDPDVAGILLDAKGLKNAPRLPRFPELGMLSVARLLEFFPVLNPLYALHAAFPFTLLSLTDAERGHLNSVLTNQKREFVAPFGGPAYTVAKISPTDQQFQAVATFELEGHDPMAIACPSGEWPVQTKPLKVLMPIQSKVLARMVQDHCVGMDICLIGDRGVGKTTLVRTFARALGYRVYTLFCFKDMSVRDLTLRRSTDERGNTTWHFSPLVQAALSGGLAVLDGIHRLPNGALAGILGRLFCDRALALADGTQLVPRPLWEGWIANGHTEVELKSQGFQPVHPAFRVVATAETPEEKEKPWLNDEMFTLFHFSEVHSLKNIGQLTLVQKQYNLRNMSMAPIKALTEYKDALRSAARADPTLEPMLLSTRQLLHAGQHLASRPQDLRAAVQGALSAYFSFLPPPAREGITRMLQKAMSNNKVTIELQDPSEVQALQHKREIAEDRGSRLKALEQPAIGLRLGPNNRAEMILGPEIEKLKEEAADERGRWRQKVMKDARTILQQSAGRSASSGQRLDMKVTQTELIIGDVKAQRRKPKRPELVPQTHFVDIPQHIVALHSMLVDWELGRHLLLIGNQGVGKNKLADRFLGLLCSEREYLQLHRDTTVQSLTLQPALRGGIVVYEDSPLVCAVRHGRVLVIDEADKAPLEVVCILKSLADDGEFTLGDGRTIIKRDNVPLPLVGREESNALLPIADGFRMIVLANRPGFPFLGNDFYRECGDVFASHAIENPDVASEVELLRSYGPTVKQEHIVRLIGLFAELRRMVDEGVLAYPYSTRELVRIVQHLEAFPNESLEEVFENVFAFDWHEKKLRESLSDVLLGFGLGMGSGRPQAFKHGDPNKTLPADFKSAKHYDTGEYAANDGQGDNPGDVGTRDYDDKEDRTGKRNRPKAGNWDGRQHIGEGPWDGGSGGSGTAGLGGRAGPYRLDVGQDLVMLTEEEKREVPDEWHEAAKKMADEAYAHRLNELKMDKFSEQEYSSFRDPVAAQISAMRVVLQSHEAKEWERAWQKQQTHGELDENRIVDGIVGSRNIYRRRGEADNLGGEQELPKRIKFVLDCSGSMYTFNRIDQRMRRLQEATLFLIESFAGFEQKYDYAIVGHSGSGPEAEKLVSWGHAPLSPGNQLELVKRMAAHAQYSHNGDFTLEATDLAIKDVVRQAADEYYVFVVSDADLGRYNITPQAWNKILTQDRRVNAYALLISSNTDEAERIKAGLAPGHAFVCDDNDVLAVTFKQIFQATMLRNRA